MGASLGLVAGIGMGYLLASASPGGGGGGENADGDNSTGASSSVGESGTTSSDQTEEQAQEAEPLTPVYLGEDMMRVWFIFSWVECDGWPLPCMEGVTLSAGGCAESALKLRAK